MIKSQDKKRSDFRYFPIKVGRANVGFKTIGTKQFFEECIFDTFV